MKKIEAFVSPMNLDDIREELATEGVRVLITCQANSLPQPRERRRVYRGSAYAVDIVPLLKLELTVADERLDAVIEILQGVAALDTAILVTSIERAIVKAQDTTEPADTGVRLVAAKAHAEARVSSVRAALGNAVVHAWRNATC